MCFDGLCGKFFLLIPYTSPMYGSGHCQIITRSLLSPYLLETGSVLSVKTVQDACKLLGHCPLAEQEVTYSFGRYQRLGTILPFQQECVALYFWSYGL